MPQILNVNNSYSINNRKVSSKLSFKVGERFHGKVARIGNGKEVAVKMGDGWQFTAILDEGFQGDVPTTMQLQVEGYENGQLKLKVVKRDGENEGVKDAAKEALEKEGFSGKDKDLLKAMLKYSIPLKEEQILFIKSLLDFNEKINFDGNEIDEFILKFLESKGISTEVQEAVEIRGILKDFFISFKNMNKEDILFFLENNIEFGKENIESYKMIFSEEGSLERILQGIKEELLTLKNSNITEVEKKELNIGNAFKEIEEKQEGKKVVQSNNLLSKVYDENEGSKGKVSILQVLKSMVKGEDNILKEPLKEVLLNNKDMFTTKEFKSFFLELNSLNDQDSIKEVFSFLSKGEITKTLLEGELSKFFGKEISLTQEEFINLKEIIEFKLEEEATIELQKDGLKIKSSLDYGKSMELTKASENGGNIIIKDDIGKKVLEIKEIVTELLLRNKEGGAIGDKIAFLIKENINHFKLFNTVSNEYYYLDVPINKESGEYPCKLIIKDKRKEGKRIDSNHVKMVVTVKTINLGAVDGFLTVREGNLDVELKCNEEVINLIDKAKDILYKDLQALGFKINIKVRKKDEEVTLVSCRDFFNDGEIATLDTIV